MPPYTPPVSDGEEFVEEIEVLEEIELPDNDNQDEAMDDCDENAMMMDGEVVDIEDGDLMFSTENPPPDMAVATFTGHKKPVFGCALLIEQGIAVTGDQDDHAIMWRINPVEAIQELNKHLDTVTQICFSHDKVYLATGDMSGKIYVYKHRTNENVKDSWQEVWQYEMDEMSWMQWHPDANILSAGCKGGEVYVWRIPSGECKILPGNGITCAAGDWSHDGKSLLASYADGSVRLWNVKSCTATWELTTGHPLMHTGAVEVVTCDKLSPFYASGDENGKIIFYSGNGPVGVVQAEGFVECLAVAPSNEFRMIASGTETGQLVIWDFSKCSVRTNCQLPNPYGITRIKWIDAFTILTATAEGSIYGFDARSGELKFTLTGHMAPIYEIDYNDASRALLTASEDGTAKIFQIP